MIKFILYILVIFNSAVDVTGLFSSKLTRKVSKATFRPSSLNEKHHRQQERSFSSSSSSSSTLGENSQHDVLLGIRGGGGVDEGELVSTAFDWLANLGAPAALVAGGVVATLVDGRDEMAPLKSDSTAVRFAKTMCRILLLGSFGLEIISIFVTTVTGTMLLSHGDRSTGNKAGVAYQSPMGFLHHNLEFEYLTARITFLQGLFNWLASVALQNLIPREGEGHAARRMNLFIASSLTTIIIAMLSFYNRHMTFYDNYAHMLWTYTGVVFRRYIWNWPIKPLTYVLVPGLLMSCYLGYSACTAPPELEEEDA